MPSPPPPTALALPQPRLSGWPVALLSLSLSAREPKVFSDFWRSGGVWPFGEEGREDTEVWAGEWHFVGFLISQKKFLLCLDWIGLDEIAEVDGPTETKKTALSFSDGLRSV